MYNDLEGYTFHALTCMALHGALTKVQTKHPCTVYAACNDHALLLVVPCIRSVAARVPAGQRAAARNYKYCVQDTLYQVLVFYTHVCTFDVCTSRNVLYYILHTYA